MKPSQKRLSRHSRRSSFLISLLALQGSAASCTAGSFILKLKVLLHWLTTCVRGGAGEALHQSPGGPHTPQLVAQGKRVAASGRGLAGWLL